MTWLRWFSAVCLTAILSWLVGDALLHVSRSERVAAALSRHDIGLPSEDDELRMTKRIERWLQIAGVRTKFAIDQPPRRGQLNVYFTGLAAVKATGVGYGNAAYDPTIDAIFIDRFFVDPQPYQAICAASPVSHILGCRSDMASQQVIFAFIFFHELGHRQLHGVGSSAFASRPNDPKLRQMEAEADRYSLDQLKRAYSMGERVVSDPDDTLADALGFGSDGDPKITAAYKVWVDLFGALAVSTALNSFLPTPYSPFFHDLAHPSLFDRVDGLLDVAISDPSLPENAKGQFRFFHEMLAREERIPDVPFVEVTVPEPTLSVTFTELGLAALTMPHGAIYTADNAALRPTSLEQAPKVVVSIRRPSQLEAKTEITPNAVDLFWGSGGRNMAVVGSIGTYFITDKNAVQFAFPVPTNACFKWWSNVLPTPSVLAALCPDFHDQLAYVRFDKALGTMPVAALEQAVQHHMGDAMARLELLKSGDREPAITLTDQDAFIPIISTSSGIKRYSGMLTLGLPHLQPKSVTKLSLPDDLSKQEAARALFSAPGADGKPLFLVVGVGGGLKSNHWGVWLVTSDGQPILLMQRPFLVGATQQSLSRTSISDFDPSLISVQSASRGWAVVDFENEGVFLLNLRHNNVNLLYGYGGAPFHVVASESGKVALFVSGGQKIFVFSLPRLDQKP